MRKFLVAVCRVVLIAATAGFPATAQTGVEAKAQSAQPQFPDHKILYTGNLDGLTGSWTGCSGHHPCGPLTQSQLSDVSKYKGNSAILIGMGDNFGPDRDPALYNPDSVRQLRVHPVTGSTMATTLMDHSIFDAVVPGKEDFAFGVEFLRVAGSSSGGSYVNLIANNLTVQQKPPSVCHAYPTPTPSLPILPNQVSNSLTSGTASSGASGGGGGGKGKGKGGGGGGAAASGGAGASGGSSGGSSAGGCGSVAGQSGNASSNNAQNTEGITLIWPDAKSIYPWTTRIVFSVSADYPAPANGWMCPSTWKEDAGAITSSCVPWTLSPPPLGAHSLASFAPSVSTRTYSILKIKVPVEDDGSIVNSGRPAGTLTAASSVKFCALNNTGKPGCSNPFTVQAPLFPRAWIFVPHRGNGDKDYVVFGAIATDTLNGLSQVNQEWNVTSGPTPEINLSEAGSAVTQALIAFDSRNSGHRSLGILLAQMSPSEAKQLADSLGSNEYIGKTTTRIDVVFSAADAVEASPDTTVDLSRKRAQSGYYIPVVTPAPLFKQSNCLADGITKCIATLDITRNGSFFSNTPADEQLASLQEEKPSPWDTPFCSDPKNSGGSWTQQSWECRILQGMLGTMFSDISSWHPDIAILEEKDFDYVRGDFTRTNPGEEPKPEQARKILWNSGNMTRVSLLGSTLLSILQQEQAIQTANFQTLPSVRNEQRLKVLGISQASGKYYVNGTQINSTEIYSVVTSDNLTVSTSDYPLLAQQDQNLPEVYWVKDKQDKTVAIASIGSSIIGGYAPTPFPLTRLGLEATAPSQNVLPWKSDPSGIVSKPTTPTWTYSIRTLPNTDKTDTISKFERSPQLRPLLNISLQQLAFTYSLSDPSQQDQYIGTNFGGVTNPNVATPHSDSIGVTEDVRMTYYPRRDKCLFCLGDVGLDSQINFTRSRQGSTTAAATPTVTTTGGTVPEESITYPGNTYIWSPFLEFQTSKVNSWKPVVIRPPLFTTNIVPLPQYLASATKGTDFFFSQRQTTSLGFNLGTRLEKNDFNYFEAGYSDQLSFNVLSAIAMTGQAPCILTGQATLSSCAATFTPASGSLLIPTYSTYNQKGGYWLGMLTHPFPISRNALFLYQGTAFGNFFAYGQAGTSTTLTRYAVEWTNALQVQLPTNFTLGPTYNVFFYQANTRHVIGSSLTRQSVGFQFNYSFNWHTGITLKDALTGKPQ